ncbi:type II secretion system F family protein [Litchfieldia salsa]|uniref:Tight adherence protein B n=1 Tax=Litchfieldia salsa TaxID=930152 RepID=A0A1H0UCV5_9BACI|nr:type II secretion system F family protein [Litchfieldia salsa]SDP63696.1 tight adherence protein B [Litchfieldia salsa]
MDELLKAFCVFVIVTILFFLIASIYKKKSHFNRRVNAYIPIEVVENKNEKRNKESFLKKQVAILSRSFKGLQFNKKNEILLQQAGSSLKPEEFFAYRILGALTSGLLCTVIGVQWFISLIGILIGFTVPVLLMKQRRKKRLQLLPLQLIDTLGMMSNSMRAGFSFIQALQLAAREMPDPLGPEFDRSIREISLGIPMEEVFEGLIHRLPNKELEVALQAMIAQRKSGGNLAELLETMEDTIRGRVRILAELNTLTAQGKMSSWIITLLPIVLGVYLYLINPEYFMPLISNPLGIALLVTAIIFVILGWFLIQKIVQIEV